MTNFMTYQYMEVEPGPYVNLLLGPNGTGKSTVACAIGLGLAGSMACIGRLELLSEYVRHGQQEAVITITLHAANRNGTDMYIERAFDLQNKSTFRINGKHVNQKQVLAEMNRLNIQVNNLTVYLAQFKVGEFAELGPSDILKQTEIAADPHLHSVHVRLIDLRAALSSLTIQCVEQNRNLVRLRSEYEAMTVEVERYKSRQDLERRVDILKKRIPWIEYEQGKQQLKEARQQLSEAENQLKRERNKQAPIRNKLNECVKRLHQCVHSFDASKHELLTADNKRNSLFEQLDSLNDSVVLIEKQLISYAKQRIANERQLSSVIAELETVKQQIQTLSTTSSVSLLHERLKQLNEQFCQLQLQHRRHLTKIHQLKDSIENNKRKQSKLQQQLLSPRDHVALVLSRLRPEHDPDVNNSYQIVQQARQQNKLKQPVFGPIIAHLTVQHPQIAAYTEFIIPRAIKYAFVVQCKEDWNYLSERIRNTVISVTNIQNNPKRQGDLNYLSSHGVVGWLDSAITCPPAVMCVLYDHAKVHTAAYTLTEPTPTQREALFMKQHQDQGTAFLLTPSLVSRVTISAYGAHDTRIVNQALTEGKVLIASDANEDENAELQQLKQQFQHEQSEHQLLQQQLDTFDTEQSQHQFQLRQVQDEKDNILKQLETSKQLHSTFDYLTDKQNKLQSALNKTSEKQQLETKLSKLNSTRFTVLQQLSHASATMLSALSSYQCTALQRCQCQDTVNHITSIIQQVEQQFTSFEQSVQQSKQRCRQCVEQLKVLKQHAETVCAPSVFEGEQEWLPNTIDEIQSQLLEYQFQIDASVADASLLARYRARQIELDKLQQQCTNDNSTLEQQQTALNELDNEWRPRIRTLVSTIDEQFQHYFSAIGCLGRVVLVEQDNEYDKYGIDIRVAFRQGAPLQSLKASAQSGGEKSVSTMLYLLTLQSVTNCPFRLVDEINQGMDPSNERKIFDQIVHSCEQPEAPQYFVVTPKLLPNLQYSDRITTLTVYNGQQMITAPEWNLSQFCHWASVHAHKRKQQQPTSSRTHFHSPSPSPSQRQRVRY